MIKEVSAEDRCHQEHRQRVINARSMVDHYPPIIHAGNFLRISKLKEDADTYMQAAKQNISLLVTLNNLMRTHGIVDSFRHSVASGIKRSGIHAARAQIQNIEVENNKMGKRILYTKGKLYTGRLVEDGNKKRCKVRPFKYPETVLKKYVNLINIPSNVNIQQKFLRPRIYIDLEVLNIRPLGRIIIELFTEAAPQIVLEFVRLAFRQDHKKIKFLRLFPSLWLEGEFKLEPNSTIRKNIEFDKRAIDHGKYGGILSYSHKFVPNFTLNMINFVISMKPLHVLNGHRIGFGKVVNGMKLLDSIQDYGTKNGKPVHEIKVKRIGVVT